ncbi:putative major facilitator superfamily protein [Neofusicoccum parvum]|uniref:Major facilitator superfamily protein n=2 Tax=Neofusicoccum parvum TaxID=310453 RepID=A0ACB5SKH6_9PEZI|nr:putative major facilitator superfamily protein [Neofusicoccum parvum UCRNP2]GME43082.1 putative major facilitator superfamily protein [Neofusicoccum parvum]GME45899.1 putative major facilitator superfamily protein [Neofusicoccum parvum]
MEQGSIREKGEEAPSAEQPDDPFIVDWEPADDAINPTKWSPARKWTTIGVLSFITFLTPLASSMFAPGVPQVMADFKNGSQMLATFVVAVYVLGFAFGPLFLAPLSEVYGRNPVYHVCNVFFTIFTVCCAVAKNMGMLIVFRFLAGLAGVSVVTCGSGSISDMLPAEQRGTAMAIWSMGPLLGPVVGPIAGGYLTEAKSWRWVFYVITIVAGFITVVSWFTLRETYHPVLLEKKAARLRKETGNPAYRSKYATDDTTAEVFKHALIRPLKMLFLSPIINLMCMYIAITYGILYILFTTFTFVFEDQYGFNTSSAGLTYIGSGVGSLLGLLAVGSMSDKLLKRKIAAGGRIRPEDRLPLVLTVPAGLSLPIGLFIYGWTADKKVHWIAPMIGTGITGFGMICILICIQTYLVDAFTKHAASVNAANAVLRSLLGALLPLCGLDMYDALGLGWGNTLLGFLALMLAPAPWLFYFYGERIRTNPKWQRQF